jgi:hypothetical protein
MKDEQIKSLIEIFIKEIDVEKWNNIIMAAFSGNERIKHYDIGVYYNYCNLKEKNIKKKQFKLVINYLSKYYEDVIKIVPPGTTYHTESYPHNLNVEKEVEILRVLRLYKERIL